MRRLAWGLLIVLAVLALAAGAFFLDAREPRGASAADVATPDRVARMRRSPAWQGERFGNALPTFQGRTSTLFRRWVVGGSDFATPDAPIPVQRRVASDFTSSPESGLRVTWFGHSSMLLEIDGARVLIDPVWGERASPFSLVGPKRFYDPPMPVESLPPVDAVLISHDHYDHLDLPTVHALASRGVRWFVPLGVGAHLVRWGVRADHVTELDWWESAVVRDITLTATPARHFSGRWLDDRNRTLWSGWAVAGPAHRAFYSGDTALFDELVAIGERLGPFDLTMIETGAYDALWPDVHLGPEQAVLAHVLVRGDVMLPVHWGLFNLAMHGWTEPIERTLVAAAAAGVRAASPMPGGQVEPARFTSQPRWWPSVPWQTAVEHPVRSTGVDSLHRRSAPRDTTSRLPSPPASAAPRR